MSAAELADSDLELKTVSGDVKRQGPRPAGAAARQAP